ncbi:MAG TPA: bifunctional phosphoribosylaminoimidazolecarboxamide formyltransferase/IMP cyclohydrolase [Blastocatellia bacterium]|nr:bifunctional phosphoribosylaminoimidazolecarboxamide formyltransferase/IMP cyclohydrolase [Blastocatellia bacterium]
MSDHSLKKIRRALISVSNKTGIVQLAQALSRHGIELVSTGGTARLLREQGLEVRDVSDLTGFPEMLDGRVKTLHPKVHGGILGIRDNQEHQQQMQAQQIAPIDLVVVNLYPFRETIAKPGVKLEDAIENIDIGGPAMIRSAAKNHADVAVVVEPADYERVSAELDQHDGALSQGTRFELAVTAFRHTAAYDRDIAKFLSGVGAEAPEAFPAELDLSLRKVSDLRYGENPHQRAALYQLAGANETGVANAEQLQGRELSYNNLIDADGAWNLIIEMHRIQMAGTDNPLHSCAIIKHTNPCGAGVAGSAREAFLNAKATDPVSAFGGIIAFSRTVDEEAAREIAEMFAEVIIAPDFTADARQVLAAKKNLRVLRMGEAGLAASGQSLEFRKISGGVLVQDQDSELIDEAKLQVVTERRPTPAELSALRFAWAICKHVKSNAIVYASEHQLVGVGAGQMSRVDSVRIGAMKAQLPLGGTVLASDAFFPFRDGVDEAAKHGITAIIQPGGSVRDAEVIQAANEHGLAMLFTGLRHFKH